MTPAELAEARQRLGMKASDLGRALELADKVPGRQIRRWETGEAAIPGPAAVAIRLMLELRALRGLQSAVNEAQAVLQPPVPEPAPLASEPAQVALKTRRRG